MAALTLSVGDYRDRVLGGWLGKSIGVTLGAPIRGQMVPGRSNFYNPVPGQPAASMAVDFPIIWLHTLEKVGVDVAPEDLAVAWLEHLDYPQDEFGYAALNLRRGLPPPGSGHFANFYRHATGGVMRADFWAMIAPGNPQAAAAYAYHDAKLDHSEEGIWAAMFLAAVGSASFFLDDPLTLVTIGLAMIPRTSRTARGVKTALAAAHRGAAWLEARESVQHEVGDKNFTDAPQNLGFLTIGMMYGLRDFGAGMCAAVNCGYDSEIVGGALGAILGIQRGSFGLPENWTRPVGDLVIPGPGIRDYDVPHSLVELADRTVAIGRSVVAARCSDVAIVETSGIAPNNAVVNDAVAAVPDSHLTPINSPTPAVDFSSTNLTAAFSEASPAAQPSSAVVAPDFDGPNSVIDISPENPEGVSGEATAESPVSTTEDNKSDSKSNDGNEGATESSQPGESPLEAQPDPEIESSIPVPLVGAPTLPVADALTHDTQIDGEISTPGFFKPQAVSRDVNVIEPGPEPIVSAPPAAQIVAPDPTSAIAWADSTLVKPLLVTPPNSQVEGHGDFLVSMDCGDNAAIAYNAQTVVSFLIVNRGEKAFSGRSTLLAPPGWQVQYASPSSQRQYIAAHTGTHRADFSIFVPDGVARIDIANAIALRLDPDDGGESIELGFVLMGASCWWTVGPFANFDGEGFDRSYAPEDRPDFGETYVSRNLQPIHWERRCITESSGDLEQMFKGASGVCYGRTTLRSPTAREARIVANTNSGVKVWMNGSLIFRRNQRTTYRPQIGSGIWSMDVSLRAGDNPIMVKWVRAAEPFEFSLSVSDRQGRGLPEVGNTSW